MTLQQFSLIWDGRYDSLEPGQRLRIDERSTASFRGLRWSSSGSLSRGIYVCVSSFPVGFSEESCPSEWSRERSAPSSVARVCRKDNSMPSISSSPHSTGGGGSVSLITKLEDQAGLGHPVTGGTRRVGVRPA